MKLPFLHKVFYLGLFILSLNLHAQVSHEEQMLQSIESEKNPRKKFSRMMSLAEYYKENNIRKADSIRHVLLQDSHILDDSIRFSALFYFAEVSLLVGNLEEYHNTILECQPYLNILDSKDVEFKIFRHLGYYHSYMQEFETADFYLKKSYLFAKQLQSKEYTFEALQYIALNFMYNSKKDSALAYMKKAITTARRINDRSYAAIALNTQARIYDFFGQLELSVAKNTLARRIAEQVRDKHLLAKIKREMGQSQLEINNLDEAERTFNESYEYASAIHDMRQIALALSNLAAVQLKKKNLDNAIQNAERAIEYLTELNDNNGLGEAHNILGMIYKEKKMYAKASSNFNLALIYYEVNNNKEKIAHVYHNVGTVFKEQKRYNNALNYLKRSVEIREVYGAKNQIYHTYRVMADVYKELNNTQKSLEYLELYVNYLDSNTMLQTATKIAELTESYRAEQRERLITQQADSLRRQQQERTLTATKLENSQLRNNFQWYFIVGFIIIIILGGVILFYRWNQTNIRQQQHEAEMSQKLLRSQMNPHFVFNAMSVIQSYIFENDTVNSSKFLVNFSRLMRLILENSPKEYIPIETEIEILNKYLQIQKLRFQDRFDFEITADDALFDESAILPPMITQPFIENAIEHGQLHTIEGGFINVTFTKQKNMLHITIVDNGIGRDASRAMKKSSAHKSMAMDITRQRIDTINRKSHTEGYLLVEDYDKKLKTGTKVLISLPYTIATKPLI